MSEYVPFQIIIKNGKHDFVPIKNKEIDYDSIIKIQLQQVTDQHKNILEVRKYESSI